MTAKVERRSEQNASTYPDVLNDRRSFADQAGGLQICNLLPCRHQQLQAKICLMEASHRSLFIRPARQSDSDDLSRICLLTGDAGKSAEGFHSIPELPGLFYACPYVRLPHAGGFVLVRRRESEPDGQKDSGAVQEDVLGYILLAYDTRAFEEALEREWFPPLRAKYPAPKDDTLQTTYSTQLTDADKRYIKLLHAPDRAPDACVSFSAAHLHIDLLSEVQRQGWGRRLIDTAVKFARDEKGLSSVWLGMDPKNVDAACFYERLGFQPIEGAPSNYVGLKFANWQST